MANIMITEKCNLRCPYCFANEFVGKSTEDITLENFRKALEFALTNPNEEIGIIGGEPTMHKDFKEMLQIVIADERIQRCTVFTNGILIDRYVNEIIHPKFTLLINCNSPQDAGEEQFKKMEKNIGLLTQTYYMRDRITLGINMYKLKFDWKYIVEVLEKYGFKTVRTSISVPNHQVLPSKKALDYFYEIKEDVLDFYYHLLEKGIMPFYDCNALPKCILEESDIRKLEQKILFSGCDDKNLLSDVVTCEPVIDILPDLRVIRCFALSECEKVPLVQFNTIFETKAYFKQCFDTLACHVISHKRCKECYERKTLKCSGGCYAFKIDAIGKLRIQDLFY